VRFEVQNRDDRCGSAAASIIIEFWKTHDRGGIPVELTPERVTYQRVGRALHKVQTPKITSWAPIQEQKIGVECPRCGKFLGTWEKQKEREVNTSSV